LAGWVTSPHPNFAAAASTSILLLVAEFSPGLLHIVATLRFLVVFEVVQNGSKHCLGLESVLVDLEEGLRNPSCIENTLINCLLLVSHYMSNAMRVTFKGALL
jgi:hypothetical protein